MMSIKKRLLAAWIALSGGMPDVIPQNDQKSIDQINDNVVKLEERIDALEEFEAEIKRKGAPEEEFAGGGHIPWSQRRSRRWQGFQPDKVLANSRKAAEEAAKR